MAAAQTPPPSVTSCSSYSNCYMKLIGANFFVGCLKALFKNCCVTKMCIGFSSSWNPDRTGPGRSVAAKHELRKQPEGLPCVFSPPVSWNDCSHYWC